MSDITTAQSATVRSLEANHGYSLGIVRYADGDIEGIAPGGYVFRIAPDGSITDSFQPAPTPGVSAFDRYRAARASLLIGINASPAPRDTGILHGPLSLSQEVNRRTAAFAVALRDSHRVNGTSRTV